MDAFVEVLGKTGVSVSCGTDRMEVDARSVGPGALQPVDLETGPYPAFPTDLQPPTSVLLSQAQGTSRIHEAIFEDRLEWLGELRKMGAEVELKGSQRAVIHGPAQLHGADVEISDLRAGASLILAALAADGTSSIRGAHHVRRGYENIERKFLDLGARIERVQEGESVQPA
jgi:UDP-N-acetylglucosamine 1-carboxyvinyltransferase